ncbi:PDZ domain-containing protein 7 [Nilaparvata lugens]|uniref:PDZ domain-containing protein 7 n=1 Tax=Nilaparvata lugens TaxID=108931 RepID=UPI00193CD81E|nr:PDZ domain-containing protein 7 [Nilaparvata lugens]
MALTSSLPGARLPLPPALRPGPGAVEPQYAASSSSDSGGGASSDSQTGGGGSRHRVRTVCLSRRRLATALGFSVRGGREHGTGFFVSAVDVGSEAHARGLQPGDQIIRINGFPVEDATHREVLQLIQGQMNITLKVRSVGMIPVKDSFNDALTWKLVESSDCSLVPTSLSSNQSDVCDDHPPLQSHNEVRIVLHVAPRAKLGCGICKGPEWRPGIFIQFTKENGLARGAGLRPGDQILKCNNITFTPETPFNEAVSVLRSSGLLELQVRKGAGLDLFPGESSGYNSSASSVAGDQSPETWLNKRLSIVKEESVIDSESRLSHNDLNRNYLDKKDVGLLSNGSSQNSSNKSTNTENIGTCTVIRVGSDEPTIDSSRRTDSTNDSHKNKLAEICMVSQQTETKTTTVLVEVHQSEEESTQTKCEKAGLVNSSSVSSFTSTSSTTNSLSSAISQELQRRSQRRASDTSELNKLDTSPAGRNLDIVRSGLDKEKVQQHEQLMEEFKMAHRRMFSTSTTSSSTSGTASDLDISSHSDSNSHSPPVEREIQRAQEQLQQQQKLEQQQQVQQQQKQQQPQIQQQPLKPNVPKQHLPKPQAPLPPPLQHLLNPAKPSAPNGLTNGIVKNAAKPPAPNGLTNGLVKNVAKPSTANGLTNGIVKSGPNADQDASKQFRSRQHSSSVPPPPPPPLPKDESDGSTTSTIKLSTFAGGKRPAGGGSTPVPPPPPPPAPPSPPACPTPDYDTMSLASEHDGRRPTPKTMPMAHRNGKTSTVMVNGGTRNGHSDAVEMESLESFKLTNPSQVRPKPPATYFAQNRKSASRSSDSSLNSRNSMQNVAVEGAKPTITIREYPTTMDRKNPTRFQFLNQNEGTPVVSRDQPISSQLHSELTQTLSRVKLQSSNSQESPPNGMTNGTGKTNVVTICVNPNQKPAANGQQPSDTKNGSQPFYLFPRKAEDNQPHQRMVSTTLISKSDLQDVELRKTSANARYPDNGNRNSVTFNFGNGEKTELRANGTTQPNGILKNGTANGNVSHVQVQNVNATANSRLPQQHKSIKFGGITTIIRNSPEPKM